MTLITKTITIVLFAGLFAISVACEAKTNTKGKFHLVYLVSAEKLEVGAKVFVEPLFFTDGKKIVSLSVYCRDLYLNKKVKTLTIKNISDDLKIVHGYCKNKSITINSELMHAINNSGKSIVLDKIRINRKRISTEGVALPIVSKYGYAFIKYVSNNKIASSHSRYYFASMNKKILMKIVPEEIIYSDKINKLFYKARKIAIEEISHNEELDYMPQLEFISPIVLDFDKDGAKDLFVGIHSNRKDKRKNNITTDSIFILVLIYGNASKTVDYIKLSKKQSMKYKKHDIQPNLPLGVIKIGKCLYGPYLKAYVYDYYLFLKLNKSNKLCKDIIITRNELDAVEPPEGM